MKTSSGDQSQVAIANLLQQVVVCAHEATNIVLRAGEDLLKNQCELGVVKFAEDLPDVTSFMSSAGPAPLVWQVPALWQTQFRHMTQVMLDAVAVVARAQQQLLALGAPSFAARPHPHAMPAATWVWARPEATAQVITLANRRPLALPDGATRIPAATAKPGRKASRGDSQQSACA